MRTEVAQSGAAGQGAGVRLAVIDSGVHANHPHVGGVAGGVAVDGTGHVSGDFVDRIGHGTAVMAAIREKAPQAECHAVRIFDTRLSASAATLLAAIDWAISERMHIINLSLGTSNRAHAAAFEAAVSRAVAAGVAVVAARDDDGVRWLPGCLPGVVQVQVDWNCPREHVQVARVEGEVVFRASGFARPIPGVDPRHNLHGVSFAVANVSGVLARAFSAARPSAMRDPVGCLERYVGGREGREWQEGLVGQEGLERLKGLERLEGLEGLEGREG
jgi:subtilisin family serine protease